MKIRELMQSNVVTIGEDTPAKDAYELMRTHRLRHLPVVNRDNQLVGIVSDRDLLNVAVIFKKHRRVLRNITSTTRSKPAMS